MGGSRNGMMEGFEDLQASGGKHGWDANQKRKLGCGNAVESEKQGEQNRYARAGRPWKYRCNELSNTNRKNDRPGDFTLMNLALQPFLNGHKQNPSDKQGDRN